MSYSLTSSNNDLCVYYKDGSIIGCVKGYNMDTKTQAKGTAYINVEYPQDKNYKKVEFDDYKVYFIKAEKD